jgi:hypothetical protein
MSLSIILATFDFNGTVISDISEVKENEVELGKEVEFVDHTGFAPTARKYGFSVKYKPPQTGRIDLAAQDYSGDDVTFTVYYDGGTSRTYHGIRCLKEGESTLDGKNEVAIEYSFHAAKRVGP